MKTTLALLISLTTACFAEDGWITNSMFVTNKFSTGYVPNHGGYWSNYSSNRLTIPATINSITITNFVEGNNQRGCSTCEMLRKASETGVIPAIYHPWHNTEPWREADEKWTITSVIQRNTIIIEWERKSLTNIVETILSSTTNRWKLAQEWRKE